LLRLVTVPFVVTVDARYVYAFTRLITLLLFCSTFGLFTFVDLPFYVPVLRSRYVPVYVYVYVCYVTAVTHVTHLLFHVTHTLRCLRYVVALHCARLRCYVCYVAFDC